MMKLGTRFSTTIKRWWGFKKHKFSLYLMILSSVVFTALIDFSVGNNNVIVSHIDAINRVSVSSVALYFFLIYFMALLQIATMINCVKSHSPKSMILVTFITILQIIFVILYVQVFFTEHTRLASYKMTQSTYLSIIIFAVGLILSVFATVWAWFFVDWRYKKVED